MHTSPTARGVAKQSTGHLSRKWCTPRLKLQMLSLLLPLILLLLMLLLWPRMAWWDSIFLRNTQPQRPRSLSCVVALSAKLAAFGGKLVTVAKPATVMYHYASRLALRTTTPEASTDSRLLEMASLVRVNSGQENHKYAWARAAVYDFDSKALHGPGCHDDQADALPRKVPSLYLCCRRQWCLTRFHCLHYYRRAYVRASNTP